MGEMDSYKSNCEFIRKEFKMTEDVSLYAIVNRVTEAYKDFKDKEEIERLKKEESALAEKSQTKEKKRGRPRKK